MQDILTVLADARAKIDRKGFALQKSSQYSVDYQICCHTLGMPGQGLPDLVIYMPDRENAEQLGMQLLNEVANLQITQGKFAHGRVLRKDVFPDIPAESRVTLTLLEVNPMFSQQLFALNKVLLRGKTFTQEAFQVTYPDDNGNYPWQPGSALTSLRLLGRPPE